MSSYEKSHHFICFILQEIQLLDVISIEMAKVKPSPDQSKAPHVFEIRLQNVTYFVGEDPTFGGGEGSFVVSTESGSGLEQAKYWEHAIRQALMPVTPTTSVSDSKSNGEWLLLFFICHFLVTL